MTSALLYPPPFTDSLIRSTVTSRCFHSPTTKSYARLDSDSPSDTRDVWGGGGGGQSVSFQASNARRIGNYRRTSRAFDNFFTQRASQSQRSRRNERPSVTHIRVDEPRTPVSRRRYDLSLFNGFSFLPTPISVLPVPLTFYRPMSSPPVFLFTDLYDTSLYAIFQYFLTSRFFQPFYFSTRLSVPIFSYTHHILRFPSYFSFLPIFRLYYDSLALSALTCTTFFFVT